MKEFEITYYLIYDRLVGKREKTGKGIEDYVFEKETWLKDTRCVIMDHLVGFDPSEDADSPYRFGNGSVLREMHTISEEEANQVINEQMGKRNPG